jgi:hypothetical protein
MQQARDQIAKVGLLAVRSRADREEYSELQASHQVAQVELL